MHNNSNSFFSDGGLVTRKQPQGRFRAIGVDFHAKRRSSRDLATRGVTPNDYLATHVTRHQLSAPGVCVRACARSFLLSLHSHLEAHPRGPHLVSAHNGSRPRHADATVDEHGTYRQARRARRARACVRLGVGWGRRGQCVCVRHIPPASMPPAMKSQQAGSSFTRSASSCGPHASTRALLIPRCITAAVRPRHRNALGRWAPK
jgi:hypothetical protein